MARLDKQRQELLEPKRLEKSIKEIEKTGLKISNHTNKIIWFLYKGHPVTYYVYSGWATGKSIKDGRGLNKLINQLKNK